MRPEDELTLVVDGVSGVYKVMTISASISENNVCIPSCLRVKKVQ